MLHEPAEPTKCLHCGGEVFTRGVCRKRYDQLQPRVRRGQTTWDALVSAGEVLPGKINPNETEEQTVARFWAHVNKNSGVFAVVRGERSECWLWTYYTDRGYGKFGVKGKVVPAHVFAYELLHGPTPGLVKDHLCRHRACVRPDHLEPVTREVNVSRGDRKLFGARGRRVTHCPKGHPYDEANTGLMRSTKGSQLRGCKACRNSKKRQMRAAGSWT